MIQFANKGSLMCFSRSSSFCQFIFSIVKREFLQKRGKCATQHEGEV